MFVFCFNTWVCGDSFDLEGRLKSLLNKLQIWAVVHYCLDGLK